MLLCSYSPAFHFYTPSLLSGAYPLQSGLSFIVCNISHLSVLTILSRYVILSVLLLVSMAILLVVGAMYDQYVLESVQY